MERVFYVAVDHWNRSRSTPVTPVVYAKRAQWRSNYEQNERVTRMKRYCSHGEFKAV